MQDDLDQIEHVTGQVEAVWITATKRTYYVIGDDPRNHAEIAFPGNDPRFEEELLRAQSDGRIIGVTFRRDASGVVKLESTWTFAGRSSASPRY